MELLYKLILFSTVISNFWQFNNCQVLNRPTNKLENFVQLVKNKFSPIHVIRKGAEFIFNRILQFPKEISRDCFNDVKETFMEAINPKMWTNLPTNWPAQLLDSLAKPPSGVMNYNIFWLGSFQQCIDVVAPLKNSSGEKFIGEYCLIDFYPKILPIDILNLTKGMDVSLKIGLCFPSTCSLEDKLRLLNYTMKYMKNYVRVGLKEENCQTKHIQSMDTTTIIIVCVLSSYGIFVLSATLVDLISSLKNENFTRDLNRSGFSMKIIVSFSAIRSLNAIFHNNEERSDLRIIHGLRAISIIWVITGHTILYGIKLYPWRNQAEMRLIFDYFLTQPFVFGSNYSVTTFFVISGFLVTYLFIQRSCDRHQCPNIFGYYIFRVLRLTAPLILLVLFLSGPFNYLNKGPIWPEVYNSNLKVCRRLGWMSILYIQNFVTEEQSCFPAGWYLSADTQLYFLAPTILYPLYRKPFFGLLLMGIYFLSTVILSTSRIAMTGHATFLGKNTNYEEAMNFNNDIYRTTFYNAPSFIIGMAAGYLLLFMQRNRIILLKKTIISCWICALTIMAVIIYGTYPYFNGTSKMSPLVNVLYGSLARPTWALAISWIILACALGYGGKINRLLIQPPFVVLGRLTYCAYLVHSPILDYYYYGQKDGLYFSIYNMAMAAFSTTVMTTIMAILFAVIIEMPMVEILKLLRTKYYKSDENSTRKQLTLTVANFEKTLEIQELHDLLLEDSSQDEQEYVKN